MFDSLSKARVGFADFSLPALLPGKVWKSYGQSKYVSDLEVLQNEILFKDM